MSPQAHTVPKQPAAFSAASVPAALSHSEARQVKVYRAGSLLASVKHRHSLPQLKQCPVRLDASVSPRDGEGELGRLWTAEVASVYSPSPSLLSGSLEMQATRGGYNSEVNPAVCKRETRRSPRLLLNHFEIWEDVAETWKIPEMKSSPFDESQTTVLT